MKAYGAFGSSCHKLHSQFKGAASLGDPCRDQATDWSFPDVGFQGIWCFAWSSFHKPGHSQILRGGFRSRLPFDIQEFPVPNNSWTPPGIKLGIRVFRVSGFNDINIDIGAFWAKVWG